MATQRGFGFISLVASVAIASSLVVVGYAAYHDIVEKGRDVLITSQIRSHLLHFDLHQASRFEHFKADFGNPTDYLDDAVAAGHVKPVPRKYFNDPAALRWEIGRVPSSVPGYEPTFVLYISSTNTKDQEWITRALAQMAFDSDEIELVP